MADLNPTGFDWSRAQVAYRDYLPHVRQENVVYFITFRLADSLPQERLEQLKNERAAYLQANPAPHTPQQEREYRRIWTARIENLLDAGYGDCVLRDSDCRNILESSMRHDDGMRYRLGHFVIMPNHVHAVLHVLPGQELSDTIKAWKSISARRIGAHVGRKGSIWMDEYFDHAVRDDEPLERFIEYIRQNPRNLAAGNFTVGCGTMKT